MSNFTNHLGFEGSDALEVVLVLGIKPHTKLLTKNDVKINVFKDAIYG